MSTRQQDRGIRAVARVREVRERDSRLGLMQSLAVVREREAALAARRVELADAAVFTGGGGGDFLVTRISLAAMADEVSAAAGRLAVSQTVAAQAHSHWQLDKSRLLAVEMLLENRAARRREERDRVEARELDDLVGKRFAGRPAGSGGAR